MEKKWELKTRIVEEEFNDLNFSQINFNSAVFQKVKFNDCIFSKSNFKGTKVFESLFNNCKFLKLDLSKSTLGSNDGIYKNCVFEKCNFKGKEFNFTRFSDCIFNKCTIANINFNASSFEKCKFVGKIENVSFNGIYDTNKSTYKTLVDVDFKEATFGDFVTFFDCDLSSCIPPEGKKFDDLLYYIYQNNTNVLSTGTKDKIIIEQS
ncbi:pentapeptide repeat-containing protein [Saccharicrinis sp. GN24d3]|uniref:pentapeptide repeat-containing protein n=1 Tax=Saccharicrinis sp. GN24d3 TaxID=3458416 RepID=UPI0040364E97